MAVAAPELPPYSLRAPAPDAAAEARRPSPLWSLRRWALLLALLTVAAFVVAGWHPYAEDGGMYVARVQLRLDPSLYPHFRAFVREPLRVSLFEPILAAMVRRGVPLGWSLLLLQLVTIALTLTAARCILRRLVLDDRAQLAGLALLAAWLTIPVAATSLLLVDPYLTARSFATPCTLFAVAFALEALGPATPARQRALCLFCLSLAAAFHPLMGAYAALLIAFLLLQRMSRPLLRWVAGSTTLLFAAAIVQALAPAATPASRLAEASRYYWFLSQWHSYELAGIVCPLLIAAWFAARPRPGFTRNTQILTRATLAFTLTGVSVALCCAHEGARSHSIARLQPLRTLWVLYALMPMLLGAWLACATSRPSLARRPARLRPILRALPFAAAIISAAIFAGVQRIDFAASPSLELPTLPPQTNPWVQAFLWARDHTSPADLFALDALYTALPGEDAQNFRAISLRSALPDYAKDGGVAANLPELAPAWQAAQLAQQNLSLQTDAQRHSHLDRFHPDWLVMRSAAQTEAPCPYDNGMVKICRFPAATVSSSPATPASPSWRDR